jgi:hypothetical protein
MAKPVRPDFWDTVARIADGGGVVAFAAYLANEFVPSLLQVGGLAIRNEQSMSRYYAMGLAIVLFLFARIMSRRSSVGTQRVGSKAGGQTGNRKRPKIEVKVSIIVWSVLLLVGLNGWYGRIVAHVAKEYKVAACATATVQAHESLIAARRTGEAPLQGTRMAVEATLDAQNLRATMAARAAKAASSTPSRTTTPTTTLTPTATPTPSPICYRVRIEGEVEALTQQERVIQGSFGLEAYSEDGRLLALVVNRCSASGTSECFLVEYCLPHDTTYVELWVGDDLGGDTWWTRFDARPANVRLGREIVIIIERRDATRLPGTGDTGRIPTEPRP